MGNTFTVESLYTSRSISSVVAFQRCKIFGQELTCSKENRCILRIRGAPVCQKVPKFLLTKSIFYVKNQKSKKKSFKKPMIMVTFCFKTFTNITQILALNLS